VAGWGRGRVGGFSNGGRCGQAEAGGGHCLPSGLGAAGQVGAGHLCWGRAGCLMQVLTSQRRVCGGGQATLITGLVTRLSLLGSMHCARGAMGESPQKSVGPSSRKSLS
jgi:hypothetical protein